MINPAAESTELLGQVTGFVYPNEAEVLWSILIVVYPYITGLVAGAFILASLVKLFNVEEVKPTYRLSLLTALAFLLIAPLPLVLHLGHPERSYEIFLTPQLGSAMAVFGFVYAWYLMVVLLLEIWFEYRRDLVATKLFLSLIVIQILLGMMIPLLIMAFIEIFKVNSELRKLFYFVSAILIQLGIFSTRWNVVIGGQIFSKSFRGLTTYKMEFFGIEGFLSALALLILPLIILAVLLKFLPLGEIHTKEGNKSQALDS